MREAGGFVSDFASRDRALDSGDVVAANPSIHAELLKCLNATTADMPKSQQGLLVSLQ